MKTKTIAAGVAGCLLFVGGAGYCAKAAGRDSSSITTRVLLMDDRNPSQVAHEVADTRTFYDGQKFRLTVRPRGAGYLYVLCQSSQGEAKLLFPSESGNNYVESNQTASLPGRGWFRFDQAPGVEHVFIVLAENPIQELDSAADDGGTLPMSALRRFSATSQEKGTAIEEKGIDVERTSQPVVKQLDLKHRLRIQ